MTKANDLASLLDANGDVVSSALDNVPAVPTPSLTSLGIPNHDGITVDGSGNVGIGTSSPTKHLSVDSGTTDTIAEFKSSGDRYGYIVVKDSTSSGGAMFGADDTATIIGTGGSTERMRIDSSGNVGIGTKTPSQKLEINGADARIYLTGNNTDIDMDVSANGQLHLDGNAYNFGIALNADGAQLYTNSASRDLIFGVNETEVMRVTNSRAEVKSSAADPFKIERTTVGNAAIQVTNGTDTVYFGMPTGGGFAVDTDANLAANPLFQIDDATGTVTAAAFSGDGSALTNVGGGLTSQQVYTSSGTWTKPSGIKKVKVTVTGGGGGGGQGNATDSAGGTGGAGGGGGGTAIEIIDVSNVSSVTVTVGAGGNGATSQVTGANGGTSSFGSYCSATGGGGGESNQQAGYASTATGGARGTATGGNINLHGTQGAHGMGSGTASVSVGIGGEGGGSFWGSNVAEYRGDSAANAGPAQPGRQYGVGGSGGAETNNYGTSNGGNGSAGVVVVEEYK